MRKKKTGVILAALFFLLILFSLISSKYFPLSSLLFNQKITLKKTDGRINLLLLGVGGGKHEGPNLTDTIIFVSIDSNKEKAVLVSIPRDLWTMDIKGRINTVYAKGGISMAKSFVSKIVGQPIDYVLRIDFDGVEKAISLLGGVDVYVSSAFDDYQYPISGKENDSCGHSDEELKSLATASSQLDAFPCRYLHLHFDKGLQHMDGEKALEFIRSRHATGDEGTDFARSKRQGELIKAIKDKAISLETLLNPAKIVNLYTVVKDSIDTNIKEDEFDDFIRLSTKMKNANIQNVVLDYGDEQKNRPGLLTHPETSYTYNNEWVLIPRVGNGDFSEIQKYVDCEIKTGNCPISKVFSAK
ncbi:MAG: LCP family protein [Patescibacteria group bacterium]